MKKSAALRSLMYSGDLLGVDLGSFTVKILQLKSSGKSLLVSGSAQQDVWQPLSEAKSDEERAAVYARVLRELLGAQDFKSKTAAVALSGNSVLVRFLTLSRGHKIDHDTGLPEEAKALIPFDAPEAVVDARLLESPKQGRQDRAEMLLLMAQKKTVQQSMGVLRKAGLRPAVIINDALALGNAYGFFHKMAAHEAVVLVNMGASTTSVSVMEDGVLKAVRIVNIAGNLFTRAVKREFAVTLEEAERLKLEHGLLGASATDETAVRICRILKPALKDLAGEIKRTIDVFLDKRPADYAPIGKIVLAGGTAEMKGLAETLASETGTLVEVFRPLLDARARYGGIGREKNSASVAVVCGLGLSNVLQRSSPQSRMNLLSKQARRAAALRDISPRFIAGVAVVGLIVFAAGLYASKVQRLSQLDLEAQQSLENATRAREALERKYAEKAPAPVTGNRAESPFAFLGRLKVYGVFGRHPNSVVMLSGAAGVFVAKSGRLFDENEKEIAGVTTVINNNTVVLSTARNETYSIELPK